MHSEPHRSKTSWDRCKKHPGHKQFIPIRNLTYDLIPEPYRSDNLFNLIHFMADLTVCLHVKRVSSKRPSEYVFSSFRGKNTTHTGSGFVYHVGNRSDDPVFCDCSECKVQTSGSTSAKPQDIYSQIAESKTPTLRTEVFIKTAAHVVFDNEEAKSTFIDVFYDDENDRQNSRQMRGYCLVSVDMEKDISLIKCVTHDQAMSDRLRNSLENVKKLQQKAFISYEASAKITEPKSVTTKPIVACDKSVTSQSIVSGKKSVTSQPSVLFDNFLETQLIVSSSNIISGSENTDLFHKYHHGKSEKKLKETDDDDDYKKVEKLCIFMMTDIVRSVKSKDNMRASNSEEAELEHLEISVQFPDGEKSLHNIWLFGEPVKASKEFLLNQAGIITVSPDQFVMVIKHSGMPDIIMADHLEMQSYINDLTQAEYIQIAQKDIVDDCHLLSLTL